MGHGEWTSGKGHEVTSLLRLKPHRLKKKSRFHPESTPPGARNRLLVTSASRAPAARPPAHLLGLTHGRSRAGTSARQPPRVVPVAPAPSPGERLSLVAHLKQPRRGFALSVVTRLVCLHGTDETRAPRPSAASLFVSGGCTMLLISRGTDLSSFSALRLGARVHARTRSTLCTVAGALTAGSTPTDGADGATIHRRSVHGSLDVQQKRLRESVRGVEMWLEMNPAEDVSLSVSRSTLFLRPDTPPACPQKFCFWPFRVQWPRVVLCFSPSAMLLFNSKTCRSTRPRGVSLSTWLRRFSQQQSLPVKSYRGPPGAD